MLRYAIIFAVISVIAGFFGFSGLSSATAGIAKIFFFIAIAIFLLFVGRSRASTPFELGRPPPRPRGAGASHHAS